MEDNIIRIEKCTESEINTIICCLENHFRTSTNWEIKNVLVEDIVPLCKYVYTERLEFANKSIKNCKQEGIPLFSPYKVIYSDGILRVIVPPIVEERNNILCLGDGMHRIYALIKQKIKTVQVIITHNCELPLPGDYLTWDKVQINPIQLPGHKNFYNFNRDGLTGYSKFCNSDLFLKRTQ